MVPRERARQQAGVELRQQLLRQYDPVTAVDGSAIRVRSLGDGLFERLGGGDNYFCLPHNNRY